MMISIYIIYIDYNYVYIYIYTYSQTIAKNYNIDYIDPEWAVSWSKIKRLDGEGFAHAD